MDHLLLKEHLKMSYYSFMASVYFNGVEPPFDFRLPKDTTCLALLRFKMNNMLSDTENQNVSKIECHVPWIDIDGRMKYCHIELKTNEDLKVR